jgi:alkyl sulfatase BDS1-like metallo-beta-lactamase superfamily hydrolase
VALQTTFDAVAAGGLDECYELRLGEQSFTLTVADGRLAVTRGEQPGRVVLVDTDTATLAALAWHGRPLRDAIGTGEVSIEGERSAAERLLTLFRAPMPAAVTA